MTLTLDLSNDYLIFDGLETVTVYPAAWKQSHRSDDEDVPGLAGVEVDGARIEKIVMREYAPSTGVTLMSDTRFRLPAVVLTAASYAPTVGDYIVQADDTIWTVLGVGLPRFGGLWSCDCVQLAVNAETSQRMSLLSAAVVNVAGSRVTQLTAIDTGVVARVILMGVDEIEFQEKLGFDVNYQVYTLTELDAKIGDLLEDEDTGARYEIKTWRDRQRIDSMPVYYCKRRP